uniref:60S ribosomal export protein NMD3 n=1 Tax=Callorhinchus milii TaxID=7868 RepID=A0A4W3K2P1_CALMI
MEYMKEAVASSQGHILCCQCGTPISPNPANMCVACLRTQVDITEGIQKQVNVHFCRQCERYLQPPGTWMQCALESRELLTLCLKKLKSSLTKVRLIDAGFIWTEPHSKRLKVKLTVQKEVMNGAILQQIFVVDFVILHQMCDDCHRVEAKDYWKSVVQIRQKTSHKKTFYYLEQLILKHKLHQNTLRVKEIHDGLDFYYGSKQNAMKMVDFLQCTVPCKYKASQRLISHDVHTNNYNYKSTFSVEIVPICKDNLVCLPPRLAQSLGNMGQICVCVRVTNSIHLIDPNTLQIAEVDGSTYWRYPFHSLCNPGHLDEFIIMEIDIIRNYKHIPGAGTKSKRHTLADVWVQKTSEMNTNQQYHCRTHLGHLLNHGDLVLGSVFYDRVKRIRRRNWKLKELDKDAGDMGSDIDKQYLEFLEDLEEDDIIRKNVNIYRDSSKVPVESDTDDDCAPCITLTDMLEDLCISVDATGAEGADMIE